MPNDAPWQTNWTPAAPIIGGEWAVSGGAIALGGPAENVIWQVNLCSIIFSLSETDLAGSAELCIGTDGEPSSMVAFLAAACSVGQPVDLAPTINKGLAQSNNVFYMLWPNYLWMRGEIFTGGGGASTMAAVVFYSFINEISY
jgi:hypothetical protein